MTLTIAQTRDAYNPPDWHPDGHPAMPRAVAHGRPQEMRACGFCHLVNGQGRPENASLAGLPAAYIVQQMADFKNGDRKSAEPRMGPPNAMIQDAKAATDDEIKAAAAYFSSFPFKKWIRVVEAKDVPKIAHRGIDARADQRRAPSRWASESSRCQRISRARSCATPRPDLSPTCRPAASRKASRW